MKDPGKGPQYGAPWTRDETVMAFELYCRIPFETTKANNPAVQDLAMLLGRTPASVARKLGNFGAFDPALQSRDITGLTHTSKLDRRVWDEFHADWNGLVWEASLIRQKCASSVAVEISSDTSVKFPFGPSERQAMARRRLHQDFFRETVLSSYEDSCCVTSLSVRECLIASHIVPWSEDERYRTDPTNGICLSATFDRLFDSGLMTISDDFTIRLSPVILSAPNRATREMLGPYNGRLIRKPRRFVPCLERLRWHSEHVFRK
jgi:putative restriction endonuclease